MFELWIHVSGLNCFSLYNIYIYMYVNVIIKLLANKSHLES